jgi:hypothetical protein
MTNEELEKLGIIPTGSISKPRQFFIPQLSEVGFLKIPTNSKIIDIFEMILTRGIEDGIIKGKNEKIKEIKRCLNIEDNDNEDNF